MGFGPSQRQCAETVMRIEPGLHSMAFVMINDGEPRMGLRRLALQHSAQQQDSRATCQASLLHLGVQRVESSSPPFCGLPISASFAFTGIFTDCTRRRLQGKCNDILTILTSGLYFLMMSKCTKRMFSHTRRPRPPPPPRDDDMAVAARPCSMADNGSGLE
jgi:hypothetical protein